MSSEELSTLQRMKQQASESDEAPASSLRFIDILGGDYLWTLVRNQVWLIILIAFITTAYVAIRYQCQQDAIDISQLEKDLVDAKFQVLSSSSNLTRLCRQSNLQDMLKANNDTLLHISKQPPYIIEVPED
ncbi:MAG: FtsL-like putative cell division protein [Prevotella sp.]